MSDKDLIWREADNECVKRGDVREHIQRWLSDRNKTTTELMGGLGLIPAVPQQMSAVEFLAARARMCDKYSPAGCFLHCPAYDVCVDPDRNSWATKEAVAFAEQWAREHPERSEDE